MQRMFALHGVSEVTGTNTAALRMCVQLDMILRNG